MAAEIAGGVSQGPLKELLAAGMGVCAQRSVLVALLRAVLALCNAKNVGAIFRCLEANAPMCGGILSFVWAVTFLTAWVEGLPSSVPRPRLQVDKRAMPY